MQEHVHIRTTLRNGILAVIGLSPGIAGAQSAEFRAMWATRFEWPDDNEALCKATIDTIMDDLAGANFNAVFFQIRGQADVLYPSPNEVWSPLIGGSDPGWDPLAYAIAAAHANGIEFHAYINTHTCWQSDPAWAHTPPPDQNHLYYAHCNAADLAHRDWLHHVNPNYPVQYDESDYTWLAPGAPAVQAYIRQQVMYVVENYDVDGVHFDRIRTPGSGRPSYDPISLARFNSSQSNPNALDFTEWTADQITRTVCDIRAAIMAVKPHVKVSAAVYWNLDNAPFAQHQDAAAWAQAGAMDILVPMMYYAGGAGSTWDTYLQRWLTDSGGRHVVAGHYSYQGLVSLLDQIDLTRLRGGAGNSVFSWGSFGYWAQYLSTVYADPAVRPSMPWKDNPTAGVIYGYVTGLDALPVVDARVFRSGGAPVALSTGDGFYSFIEVPPGTYSLSATFPTYADVGITGLTVGPGEAVRQDIAFTIIPSAGDFDEDGDVDLTDLTWFQWCMIGPDIFYTPTSPCFPGDMDGDYDIDLGDFGGFQEAFTG